MEIREKYVYIDTKIQYCKAYSFINNEVTYGHFVLQKINYSYLINCLDFDYQYKEIYIDMLLHFLCDKANEENVYNAEFRLWFDITKDCYVLKELEAYGIKLQPLGRGYKLLISDFCELDMVKKISSQHSVNYVFSLEQKIPEYVKTDHMLSKVMAEKSFWKEASFVYEQDNDLKAFVGLLKQDDIITCEFVYSENPIALMCVIREAVNKLKELPKGYTLEFAAINEKSMKLADELGLAKVPKRLQEYCGSVYLPDIETRLLYKDIDILRGY